MATFQRGSSVGEHVIIELRTKDKNGKYTTATVSTKIRIEDADGNQVIGWTAMTVDVAGLHTYAYNLYTDTDSNGDYTAEFETINTADSLRTYSKWTFTVEDL